MKVLMELRKQKTEQIQQARTLVDLAHQENRSLTEEEQATYGKLVQRAKELQAEEDRIIELDGLDTQTRGASDGGTGHRMSGAGDDDQKQQFESLGEFLGAVIRAEESRGLRSDPRLQYRQLGMNEGVPGDGGYLVESQLSRELVKNAYETGLLANRCRRQPIGPQANGFKINVVDESSRATGSRMGGIQAFWTAEGGLKQDSQPKFRQMELNLQKLTGLLYATDEILADTVALEAFIGEAFAEEFGFMLDDAIIRGTGAGMPQGILRSNAVVAAPAEAGQAAGSVVFENLSNMWARLPARSRRNAVWYINQEVEPQLDQLAIAAGTAALEPRFITYSNDGVLRIKGRPVIAIEQAEALGTTGDILLADLSQYLLIDKGPVESAASVHVRFIWDEQTFRFVYRVNGQPIWNKPLTPYKGANTQSPFVVLAGR